LGFAGLHGLQDAAVVSKYLFFNRMQAEALLHCPVNGDLSAKKTILDIKKSKRMLDNDFGGE
jgi:hypothetical protein